MEIKYFNDGGETALSVYNTKIKDGKIPAAVISEADFLFTNSIRNTPKIIALGDVEAYIVHVTKGATGREVIHIKNYVAPSTSDLLFEYITFHGISVGKDYPNPVTQYRVCSVKNNHTVKDMASAICKLKLFNYDSRSLGTIKIASI